MNSLPRRHTEDLDVKIENLDKMTTPPATSIFHGNLLNSSETDNQHSFVHLMRYRDTFNHKKCCNKLEAYAKPSHISKKMELFDISREATTQMFDLVQRKSLKMLL